DMMILSIERRRRVAKDKPRRSVVQGSKMVNTFVVLNEVGDGVELNGVLEGNVQAQSGLGMVQQVDVDVTTLNGVGEDVELTNVLHHIERTQEEGINRNEEFEVNSVGENVRSGTLQDAQMPKNCLEEHEQNVSDTARTSLEVLSLED
ncbi:unnamed protein product, partial [Ilex paraguariensis]